jgi:hypothetical protein
MQQQIDKKPVGVYPLPSGRWQARHSRTHLGVYDTAKEAELVVLSVKNKQPNPRVPIPIEYAICQSKESGSYYVKLSIKQASGKRKTEHIGTYRSLEVARIARNSALRKNGITPDPKYGIDLSIIEKMPPLPCDKRRTFDAQNTKEAKARKERKKPTAKQQIVIAVDKTHSVVKKSTLPPTLTFNPPPELPDLTGVVHEVGVFKINGAWVAFVNYKPIPATSPEDGQRIIERGGKLKLKGDN